MNSVCIYAVTVKSVNYLMRCKWDGVSQSKRRQLENGKSLGSNPFTLLSSYPLRSDDFATKPNTFTWLDCPELQRSLIAYVKQLKIVRTAGCVSCR